MKLMELTAVFVEGEYGYTAYIEQMKGVITQGTTIEEAEQNLIDALQLYLEPDDSNEIGLDQSVRVIRKTLVSLTRAV